MTDEKFVSFLSDSFLHLPRKSIPAFRPDLVWLKIKPRLREAVPPKSSWLSDFVFLRLKLSRGLATLAIIVLLVSLVRGSAQALPGQTLYPVKKAAEQVEKVLAVNDEAKVKVGIKHAKRRLTEVQILIATNKEPQIVARTVEALTKTTISTAAVSAEKPELATQVVELANHEEQILGSVSQEASGEIKEALEKAIIIAKESANSLQVSGQPEEEVQGASETNVTEEATTTETTTAGKPKPKDSLLQSDIQIHDVIQGEGGETDNPPESEILPEPN